MTLVSLNIKVIDYTYCVT